MIKLKNQLQFDKICYNPEIGIGYFFKEGDTKINTSERDLIEIEKQQVDTELVHFIKCMYTEIEAHSFCQMIYKVQNNNETFFAV